MDKKTITRDILAKEVAKTLGINFSLAKKALKEIEDIIIDDLKTKSRVCVKGFGTFYVRERKSRTIKQIGTGQSRLLLQHKAVKFKASQDFKDSLNGNIRTKKVVQPVVQSKVGVEIKEEKIVPVIQAEQPVPEPEEPVEIEQTKPALPESIDLDARPSGKVFASLIKQIRAMGGSSVNFSLEDVNITHIYSPRPRRLIAKIPTKIINDFISHYINFSNKHFAEQKIVKVFSSSNSVSDCYLDLHFLSTFGGASIDVVILNEI